MCWSHEFATCVHFRQMYTQLCKKPWESWVAKKKNGDLEKVLNFVNLAFPVLREGYTNLQGEVFFASPIFPHFGNMWHCKGAYKCSCKPHKASLKYRRQLWAGL